MTQSDERRLITDARTMRAVAHPARIALLEALQVEGPLTATRAAELLGDSPGNMSWHLQTLAKYGFVEEAGGGRGRSRPWRIVRRLNSFDTSLNDPERAAAGDALESTYMERNLQRLRDWWAVRRSYPARWRRSAFTSDTIAYLTASELEKVSEEINAVFARYRSRERDEGEHPAGSLAVHLVAFGHPLPPQA